VGLLPAATVARTLFRSEAACAMFCGCSAHAVVPLTRAGTAAVGLLLGAAAFTTGWPIVEGGAQGLTNALVAQLTALGGVIHLNHNVEALGELPAADATFFDTSIVAMEQIAGDGLSAAYKTRLRHFRPGPGMFKLDWALREPIPWKSAACARAATVHLGGTMEEILRSENDAFYGRVNTKPLVLLVQPSLFDATRAPAGQHTAWAYCHVPTGFDGDLTDVIEAQVERFAPGFRDVVLARRASGPAALAEWNPNLAGGDVSGGAMTLSQLVFRPTARMYRTSNERLFLCSASTPPGGGVHGMCGHMAALAALRSLG
ncbi:MAG: NAD(P)/FAD-dependent oxidoreductase, partial [Bryocella sp.]